MHRSRIQFLVLFVAIAFFGIAARLVYLQHFRWAHYHVQAETVRRSIRYISPPRGSIYDRAGRPLATDVPTHEVTYSLQGVENARTTTRYVARALSAQGSLPDDRRVGEDYLVHRLHRIRAAVRPQFAVGVTPSAQLWLGGVAAERLAALDAAIAKYPDRFPGVVVSAEHRALFVEPAQIFAGEVGVLRLARLAGVTDLDHYYTEHVWLPYQRARSIENRTARQWAFEEERVLCKDVSFETVVDVSYNPDTYPGLQIRQGRRRTYPEGVVVGQLLGYQGRPTPTHIESWKANHQLLRRSTDLSDIRTFLAIRGGSYFDDAQVGMTGLERRFESHLSGTAGATIHEVDRFQRESGPPLDEAPVVPGRDLTLTLDRDLCVMLQQEFVDREAVAGSILIATPATGEVLGWCSFPGFDPGNWRSQWDVLSQQPGSPMTSRPQRSPIPPGSTFKMLLATAALQEGLLERDETIECTGFYDPNNRNHLRCRNHSRALTDIDLETAIARSCNTFFYVLGGRRLKSSGIDRWGRMFGFGSEPGPGLGRGRPFRITHAESAAIGKGSVVATPLQVLRYVCTIANRGVRPVLHLTRDEAAPGERLEVSPWVWEEVILGMEGTVRFGSASAPGLGLRRFSCALKTGTAVQGNKDIAWLVGFAPVDDPIIAFTIALEEQDLHGGEAAGPYAAAILEWLSEHRQLPLLSQEGNR
ncbi:MAG: penicillin-binding transpeptidase domain-containing protein [Planctomycetota bacterium]